MLKYNKNYCGQNPPSPPFTKGGTPALFHFSKVRVGGFILFAFLLMGAARVVPGADSVNIYSGGAVSQIQQDNKCYNSIIKDATTLLSGSNDAYRLIVTPALINSMKKKEKAVEIMFLKPRKITISKTGATLKVSKIFIPLTGRFAKDHTTIFFANPEYGATNQVINSVNKPSRKSIEACVF